MEWKRYVGQQGAYYVMQAYGKTYTVRQGLGGFFDILIDGNPLRSMSGDDPRTLRTAKLYCERIAASEAPNTEPPIEI